MTSTPRHSVSVAAVVTDDTDKILVIKRRDTGAWQLPGGVLELHETIEDGVRREVEEETGVRVNPDRLTGIYKNMALGVVALVFHARPYGGRPHPTEEATAVEWWTAERIVAEMSETFAARVLDALAAEPTPQIRHHDGVRFLRRESA